jgi:tRNA(Ile)-lysidine synthase
MELVWPQVSRQEAREENAVMVFKLAPWRALPLALKRATVREAIHRLRRNLRNINFVHVERAVEMAERGTTGDRATLTEGLLLTVAYDAFTIADESHALPLPDWPLLEPGTWVTLNIPGRSRLPGSAWALDANMLTGPTGYRENPDPWTAYLDADVCSGSLLLRTRQPGDRIAPYGLRGHHAKLNEIMINAQVPARARDRMPILVCGKQILWACGLRMDESARVTPDTRRVLCLRFVLPNHGLITG